MITTQKRRAAISSGSLENDRLQSRSRAKRFGYPKNTELQSDASYSSDNSIVISPRKQPRKLRVSISEDTESSDNVETPHSSKNDSLRALSDYETGNSSDKTSGISGTRLHDTKSNGRIVNLSKTTVQGAYSESSDDESVSHLRISKIMKRNVNPVSTTDSSDSGIPVGFRRSVKRMKLATSNGKHNSENSCSSSSSYDSDVDTIRFTTNPGESTSVRYQTRLRSRQESNVIPIRFSTAPGAAVASGRTLTDSNAVRQQSWGISDHTEDSNSDSSVMSFRPVLRGRRRIPAIETEDEVSNDNSITPRIVTRRRQENNVAPTHSRLTNTEGNTTMVSVTFGTDVNPVRQQTRVLDHSRGSSSESSDVSFRPSLRRRRRIPEIEDDSSSDDSIRPRTVTHRRRPIFQSDNASSSDTSGSNNIFPVRNPSSRALIQSDEDNSMSAVRTAEPVDVIRKELSPEVSVKEPSGNSTDSDGESEKCPICLSRFNLQEVGIPTTCDHCFCVKCILQWAENNNTCPVDRRLFTSITIRAHIQGKILREVNIDMAIPPANSTLWWEDFSLDAVSLSESDIINAYEQLPDPTVINSDSDGPDEICCVCNLDNFNDNMILCDGCDSVYHMNCVNPPLRSVPVNQWFCPDCMETDVSSSDNDSSDSD